MGKTQMSSLMICLTMLTSFIVNDNGDIRSYIESEQPRVFNTQSDIVNNSSPLIWDMSRLNKLVKEKDSNSEVQTLIKDADAYCKTKPVEVTDKKKKISIDIDPHSYYSMGQYWWPDTLNPGSFVRKHGLTNPDSKHYDREKLSDLRKRCRTLSQAYYITGEKRYYRAFVKQLRAWFINKKTYMYPNFEFSGAVPGLFDDKGRGAGMINAYDFNDVIESVRLVNGKRAIDKRTMDQLKRWFEEFAMWAETNHGDYIVKKHNNIGLATDVFFVNAYLFSGNEKKAKAIADRFETLRINKQIKENGQQPAELQRTNAFMYSLANLEYVIDFCYLVRVWYPDYYLTHKKRIDAAFDYLGQYVATEESFPYQQIIGWKNSKKDYLVQKNRLETLKMVQ